MPDASKLYKPEFWSNPEQVHQLFTEMRHEAPVYWCRTKDYPDLWHVTRHTDVVAIENAPEVFLSAPRMTINTLAREEAVRSITGGRPYMIKPLNAMDLPEHQPMRAVVQQHFTPARIKQLKSSVDRKARDAIARMSEANGRCDFSSQIAFEYPLRVIMPILGVPEKDYSFLFRLTKQLFSPEDPDNRRPGVDLKTDPAKDMKEIHKDFYDYFSSLLIEKRKKPSQDLITEIASAMSKVKYMDQASAIHYCILLATAGHDTTSYSLSEAIYHITLNSSLLTQLQKDPVTISAKIAEEAFRLAAPTRHFIRTASQEAIIAGHRFRAGDSIILWFPSACRDELVCPDPHILRIDRHYKVPQSAFGSGPHVCLGMHLARLELICFLQEFGRRIQSIDLLAPPRYTESNFVGGIKSLPIQYQWH